MSIKAVELRSSIVLNSDTTRANNDTAKAELFKQQFKEKLGQDEDFEDKESFNEKDEKNKNNNNKRKKTTLKNKPSLSMFDRSI